MKAADYARKMVPPVQANPIWRPVLLLLVTVGSVALLLHVFEVYAGMSNEAQARQLSVEQAWLNNCAPSVVRSDEIDCTELWARKAANSRNTALVNTVYHLFLHDLNPITLVGCGQGSWCRSKLSTFVDVATAGVVFAVPVLLFFGIVAVAALLYRCYTYPSSVLSLPGNNYLVDSNVNRRVYELEGGYDSHHGSSLKRRSTTTTETH